MGSGGAGTGGRSEGAGQAEEGALGGHFWDLGDA